MNLGEKLDRLRGRASDSGRSVTIGPVAQTGALEDGGPRVPGASEADRLGECLGLRRLAAGLYLRERQPPCSAEAAPVGDDLTRLPEVHGLSDPDWVYLDTETTGLSGGVGNLAFMVGVARHGPGRTLMMRQYLIAGFGGEAAMLADLADWIGREAVIVSFNGKSFDLPLLASRMAIHQLQDSLSPLPHLDLMYTLRRAYRRAWPDCRLQTAERLRLGLRRVGDLPGAEAPTAWQRWLRQGDPMPLERVLAHNQQDVLSLTALHACLVDDYNGHGRTALDHGAVGRAWLHHGDPEPALALWRQMGDRLDDGAMLEFAATCRRLGRWPEAETLWLTLFRRGNSAAALALSKYYEHQRRDPVRAMRFTQHCEERERRVRMKRLRAKHNPNLTLPLGPVSASVG
jgi:uncharacterized protein YprB with RNaseH-like and TPR domain